MSVLVFEEHGEVLSEWLRRGFRRETVVILDHHLDLKRISDSQIERAATAASCPDSLALLNRDLPFRDDERYAYGLDNFLYAAIALELVERVVWVYPEPTPLSNKDLARTLWELLSLVPGHGDEVLASFESDERSARAQIQGVSVEMTTLRRLRHHDLRGARLDVDLDFFFAEESGITHSVEDVSSCLRAAGLADEAPTFTYSVTSGFLPDRYRWLASELAQGLGHAAEDHGRRYVDAERSLRLLAETGSVSTGAITDLAEQELCNLSGAGYSVQALLHLKSNQQGLAIDCYHRAVELGDRALWVAYSLGLEAMAKKHYQEASRWFSRAEGPLIDTISTHSRVLNSLCHYRLKGFNSAATIARSAAELVPMRRDAYVVGMQSARRLNDTDAETEFRVGLQAVDARRLEAGL